MDNSYLYITEQLGSQSMEEIAMHLSAIEPSGFVLTSQTIGDVFSTIGFSADTEAALVMTALSLACITTWCIFQKLQQRRTI